MATFHLRIVTPDRPIYDGEAERLIVRTVHGDVCILPRHIDYVSPLGIGEARVTDAAGKERAGACNRGVLCVSNGEVTIAANTFEWAEEIDRERALKAQQRAEAYLAGCKQKDERYTAAQIKLKRALLRLGLSDRI